MKYRKQVALIKRLLLIYAFVFAPWVIHFLFYLNPQFEVSIACFCDSVTVQPHSCGTWSEILIVGFLMRRLNYFLVLLVSEDKVRKRQFLAVLCNDLFFFDFSPSARNKIMHSPYLLKCFSVDF